MEHKLKHQSSFIVVVLRSLRHKACVRCGEKIDSLEESFEHWEKALKVSKQNQLRIFEKVG
jgi:hypothetical protein